MIVPRYYENLSVLHEKHNASPEPIIFRHPKEWITWWNTEKNQIVCSY